MKSFRGFVISDARAALPELLNRVTEGEEVTITRHGRPIAVVVRPDSLRSRRAESLIGESGRVRALLEEARDAPLPDEGLTTERAEALVRVMRAARDSR